MCLEPLAARVGKLSAITQCTSFHPFSFHLIFPLRLKPFMLGLFSRHDKCHKAFIRGFTASSPTSKWPFLVQVGEKKAILTKQRMVRGTVTFVYWNCLRERMLAPHDEQTVPEPSWWALSPAKAVDRWRWEQKIKHMRKDRHSNRPDCLNCGILNISVRKCAARTVICFTRSETGSPTFNCFHFSETRSRRNSHIFTHVCRGGRTVSCAQQVRVPQN